MSIDGPACQGGGRGGRGPGRGGQGGRATQGPSRGPRIEPGGGRYRRSMLEVATLAIIAESTTHGYELMDRMEDLAGALVCIDPGSMYRLLRTLEERGLVSSSWQTPEAGPSRRVYQITEDGLDALGAMADSLHQWAAAMKRLADHAAQATVTAQKARE